MARSAPGALLQFGQRIEKATAVQVTPAYSTPLHCGPRCCSIDCCYGGNNPHHRAGTNKSSDHYGAGHRGPAYWGKADIRVPNALAALRGRAPGVSAVCEAKSR